MKDGSQHMTRHALFFSNALPSRTSLKITVSRFAPSAVYCFDPPPGRRPQSDRACPRRRHHHQTGLGGAVGDFLGSASGTTSSASTTSSCGAAFAGASRTGGVTTTGTAALSSGIGPLISGSSASTTGASSTTGTFHSKLFSLPVTGETGDQRSET